MKVSRYKNNLKIEDFFINSLSYCIINKNKNIPISSSIGKNKFLLDESRDWLRNIILRKHFASDSQLPKLIYYIFPDIEVVKELKPVFSNIKFKDFIEYFRFCNNNLLECYCANEIEFFSYINFFHLIGSFRFFSKEMSNKRIIEDELYKILNEENFHPLIKYSALQITSLNTFEYSGKLNNYSNYNLFQKEYSKIIESIEKGSSLTKYISFYAIYYYESGYNFKKIVNNHLKKIIVNDLLDKEKLHTYLPQLTALLIRLNKDLFFSSKTNNKLVDLFESNSISKDGFNEVKERIVIDFKINS